jgi:hypothetical protein
MKGTYISNKRLEIENPELLKKRRKYLKYYYVNVLKKDLVALEKKRNYDRARQKNTDIIKRRKEYLNKKYSDPEYRILQNKKHQESNMRNKEKINQKRREYRKTVDYKRYVLKKKYNLSYEEYQKKINEQGGKCPICNEILITMTTDHNHTTGKVRGILCTSCNLQLGWIEKKPYLIKPMIEYLKKWEERT